MQKFFIFIIGFSIWLNGCAVYKIDIQQGNVVTQAQLDQLAVGMPAQKVRFIMGTPLLLDVFHEQRWDYFYSFKAGHATRQQRRISLFFDDNNNLAKIAGNIVVKARDPNVQPSTEPVDDRLPML